MEWLLVVIFGGGLIIALLSTIKGFINVNSKRFGCTVGHVTGYKKWPGTHELYSIVQFYIRKERFMFTDTVGSFPNPPKKIGAEVKVYYNKSNPREAFLSHKITNITFTILSFIAFCFLLAVALSK